MRKASRSSIKNLLVKRGNTKKQFIVLDAEEVSLQSFFQTGKELYTPNTLNISADLFRNFSYFSPIEQKIISETLKSETSIIEESLNHFKFYLGSFTENQLPATYLEGGIREGYYKKHEEEFHAEVNHISWFMGQILKEGGIRNPILIAESYDRSIISIGGGSHRIQAIRELIYLGKLPKDFIIPTIIIYPLEKESYKRFWWMFQTLEQKGLLDGM